MRMLLLFLILTAASCREAEVDSGLREEYEAQLEELGELEKKLEEIRKANADLEMPDPSGDLAEMAEEVAGLEKEKKSLEEKASELKGQVEEARKALAEYREKYPLQQEELKSIEK